MSRRRGREGESEAHLAFVRRLACCACPNPSGPGGEAHHLLRVGGRVAARGMGLKSPDRWAVPLCRNHHHRLHMDGNEERFFRQVGINARTLASRLWEATGDEAAGAAAVERAWREGPPPF